MLNFTNFFVIVACTTAYVPARVAHALNLKLEDYIVGCQPQQQHLHRFNSTSNVENGTNQLLILIIILN